jgi:hypothetical protein
MPQKEYFNWTEPRKHRFAIIVQKYDGHKKTGETMKDKWAKILSKVESEQEMFAGLAIKQEGLKNQFDRLKQQVLKECGISEEGANLSGLPEEGSEYQKLMICLAKEDWQIENCKKDKKDKKRGVQKALLTHEYGGLQQQGQILLGDMVLASDFSPHAANFSLATSNLEAMESSQPSSTLSSASQTANPSSKTAVKKGKTIMEKFSETTAAILQEDPVFLDLERQKKEQARHSACRDLVRRKAGGEA